MDQEPDLLYGTREEQGMLLQQVSCRYTAHMMHVTKQQLILLNKTSFSHFNSGVCWIRSQNMSYLDVLLSDFVDVSTSYYISKHESTNKKLTGWSYWHVVIICICDTQKCYNRKDQGRAEICDDGCGKSRTHKYIIINGWQLKHTYFPLSSSGSRGVRDGLRGGEGGWSGRCGERGRGEAHRGVFGLAGGRRRRSVPGTQALLAPQQAPTVQEVQILKCAAVGNLYRIFIFQLSLLFLTISIFDNGDQNVIVSFCCSYK